MANLTPAVSARLHYLRVPKTSGLHSEDIRTQIPADACDFRLMRKHQHFESSQAANLQPQTTLLVQDPRMPPSRMGSRALKA